MAASDYVIFFLLAGVLVVLIWGVFNMLTGKNPQRSNQLMMLRVTLQGIVILLVGLFLAKG